jgi:serine/threonine protein kinase
MNADQRAADEILSEQKTVTQVASGAEGTQLPDTRPPLRYKPVQFHAQGALGEVLLAQDEELYRSVALKRIQVQYADDPTSRRRFLREAQVTGRLEHPGVVPVYGLVQDADGRPCYAMRFIQGESLKDAIERFHAAEKPGRDPGERRLALRQLLTGFVTVCKTMAYSHSRGILHRDLKPANIMLGKFGETLVVDWGLARSFEREEAAQSPGEPTLQPELDGGETQVGEMVGTPAYCSPEQAAGQWDVIGPASDIFSLGAVLYNLLTNRTPYRGPGIVEIIAQASMGEVIPPRQRNKDVPRSLEAICLKAMAQQPEARYDTALALAADVEHWLADEPVEAYREPASVRAGRWLRKHRTLVAGMAAAAAVALVSLSLVLFVVAGKNIELQAANQREATRAEAERTAKDEAQKRLTQIEKGTDILGSIFNDLDPHAEEKEGKPLREILGQRVERAAGQLQGESIGDSLTVAKLQYILGSSLNGLGHFATAEALLEKAANTRAAELAEDHSDTLLAWNNLADAYYLDGKFKRAIAIYEPTLARLETKLGDDDLLTLSVRNNLANAYKSAGRTDLAIPLFESTLKARQRQLGDDHADTLTTCNNLGAAYLAADDLAKAIPLFESTLKARERTLGEDYPDTLLSRNNLASAYKAANKLDLAIALYQRTLKQSEAKLGEEHPDTLISRGNLASAYRATGQFELALPLYQRTLKAYEAKLGPDNPGSLATRNGVATVLQELGHTDQAVPLLLRNLKGCETTLGEDHPNTLAARNNLARAYQDVGRFDLAMPLFDKVVAQARKKLGANHRSTLTIIESWIGALAADHQYDKAIAASKELLPLQRKQYGSDDLRLAAALGRLGSVLVAAKQPVDAEPVLRESITIRTKKEPDAWSTFNAQALLGVALLGQKNYAEAEPLLVRGYEGMKQRQAKIPVKEKVRLTEALERLVQLCDATGKKDEAAKWRKELEAAKATSKQR